MKIPNFSPFVLLAVSLFGCNEDSLRDNTISSIEYYSEASTSLQGKKIFKYDGNNRIVSTTEAWGGPSQVSQFSYDDSRTMVTIDNKIRQYFIFDEEYLKQYIISQTFGTGTVRNDTVNFVYESGNLSAISYADKTIAVSVESNGNIVSTTDGITEFYEYDKYSNPFYKIPGNFLTPTHDEDAEMELSSLELLRYFSKNNPMHPRIVQYEYRGGQLSNIVSSPPIFCLSSCNIVERIVYRNPLLGDH